jgi:hypothetical protein
MFFSESRKSITDLKSRAYNFEVLPTNVASDILAERRIVGRAHNLTQPLCFHYFLYKIEFNRTSIFLPRVRTSNTAAGVGVFTVPIMAPMTGG